MGSRTAIRTIFNWTEHSHVKRLTCECGYRLRIFRRWNFAQAASDYRFSTVCPKCGRGHWRLATKKEVKNELEAKRRRIERDCQAELREIRKEEAREKRAKGSQGDQEAPPDEKY